MIMAPKKRRASEITRPAKRQSTSRRSSVEPRQPPPTLQHPSHGTVRFWQPICMHSIWCINIPHTIAVWGLSKRTIATICQSPRRLCLIMHACSSLMTYGAGVSPGVCAWHWRLWAARPGRGSDGAQAAHACGPQRPKGGLLGCWPLLPLNPVTWRGLPRTFHCRNVRCMRLMKQQTGICRYSKGFVSI